MKNISRIYVRLPNWIGDVCMSLPSLYAIVNTGCEVIVCAKPWAENLLKGIIGIQFLSLSGQWNKDRVIIRAHKKNNPAKGKSVGLLLPDSLTSALTFRLAGLPSAGYKDDGRSLLLKWPFDKPSKNLHAVESWYHLTHSALQKWHFKSAPHPETTLTLPLNPTDTQKAWLLLKEHRLYPGKFILIAPTATGKHKGKDKVWPKFAEYTRKIQALGYTVVMCPPPNEREAAFRNAPDALCLPAVGLGMFVALIGQAALVVCNDSGVSHLASLTRTPQITLIGVTDPKRTGPWSPTAHICGSMDNWPELDPVITLSTSILNPS
ncbi:glycosyltransferase family 9 protein [Advenella sp. RU8]|uniref:glycosyltransferase family 9 protein n=1 Tax=Advenella sp. RU8 TaxID=3399575 RepID=UPI003AAE6201